ncbi:VOC family protein [Streptosporangium sp. NPDC006930]|uniref:VOC family protein n=1 Tax=unclassified Streptosporangium TaxID=2632669 RepID=UPI003446E2CE
MGIGVPMEIQITFDANDPPSLAAFWAEALGYRLQPPPEGFGSWEAWEEAEGIPEERRSNWSAIVDPAEGRPRFYFQRVPEGKTAKNRVHLDVNVGGSPGTSLEERRERVKTEAGRLAALGAVEVRTAEENGEYWTVMTDPEGNEFCLQ